MKIETAKLIDKGGNYQILTTFKKPLGEQRPHDEVRVPKRKPSSRPRPAPRPRTPPVDNHETSFHEVTAPTSPPPNKATTAEPNDETRNETHTPRIYTEEIVVRRKIFDSIFL